MPKEIVINGKKRKAILAEQWVMIDCGNAEEAKSVYDSGFEDTTELKKQVAEYKDAAETFLKQMDELSAENKKLKEQKKSKK